MATTADLKNGMYIMFNGKPCAVVYFQHVKPGKGPAFVKTKLRNMDNADLMKEGQHVEMMFMTEPEERCLTCELPTYVTLEVTYSEPAVKGNTASTSALKEVTLETGAKIMVPLFIETGEIITVNTTDRSYGQRVK